MPDVRLRVNGREYGGWTMARVVRGIEAIAGGFDLAITDRWSGQVTPWPIAQEDECSVVVDGETAITGYVDRRTVSYGPAEHTLSVAGRDRTGDLVDCSAALKKWEFVNVPLLTLAKRLAEPFGIPVSLQPGLALPKPIAKLSVEPGDTAFDALERACRMAAVLPVSDSRGGLLLTRAGTARARTALVEGKNILGATATYDATGRFRRYIVVAQHQGSDEFFGLNAAAVTGEAQDLGVRRAARKLVVQAEGEATREYAKRRAEWEAKFRAGRSDAITITIQGWQQEDGKLWPMNALVPVRSRYLGVDGDMLITQATHSIGPSGTITDLSLQRPDAFLPEPVIPVGSTTRWKELNP